MDFQTVLNNIVQIHSFIHPFKCLKKYHNEYVSKEKIADRFANKTMAFRRLLSHSFWYSCRPAKNHLPSNRSFTCSNQFHIFSFGIYGRMN